MSSGKLRDNVHGVRLDDKRTTLRLLQGYALADSRSTTTSDMRLLHEYEIFLPSA